MAILIFTLHSHCYICFKVANMYLEVVTVYKVVSIYSNWAANFYYSIGYQLNFKNDGGHFELKNLALKYNFPSLQHLEMDSAYSK